MQKTIFFFLSALLLTACAHTGRVESSAPLATTFNTFTALSGAGKLDEATQMLSAETGRELKGNLNSKQLANYFSTLASFGVDAFKIRQSYEDITGTSGCLTLNGFSPSQKPTSVNVGFLFEQDVWKIDAIDIAYQQSPDAFPSRAVCPAKS
jgi:hypothetical protein